MLASPEMLSCTTLGTPEIHSHTILQKKQDGYPDQWQILPTSGYLHAWKIGPWVTQSSW